MELTAIYHRPESEYAYLYKEKQLHIRIRTKKDDIQKVILHYGDPFIFIEYEHSYLYYTSKLSNRDKLPVFLGIIFDEQLLLIKAKSHSSMEQLYHL